MEKSKYAVLQRFKSKLEEVKKQSALTEHDYVREKKDLSVYDFDDDADQVCETEEGSKSATENIINVIENAPIEFDSSNCATLDSTDSGISMGLSSDATQKKSDIVTPFIRKTNEKVEHVFMPGFRVTSTLLFVKAEKQFYIKNSTSKIGIGYTCYQNGCSRRVHIRGGVCFLADNGTHDHPDKSDMYIDLCALNEMKETLRSVKNRLTPRQVFDEVITR